MNDGNVRIWELVLYENIPSGSDYFPLRLNYTWTFTLDGENETTWTVDSVEPYKDIESIDLPTNAPTTGEVIQFLKDTLLPEVDGALANLSKIDETLIIMVTAAELNGDEDQEVDYGDVCLYRSSLYILRAAISILSAYDLNVDIYDIVTKIQDDIFNIKRDIIDSYTTLLTVIDGDKLLEARQDLIDAINAYMEGSDFIRSETDDQGDDLITIEPDDRQDEQRFRVALGQVKDSLNGTASTPFKVELSQFLDLGLFFENPVNLRDFLTTGGIKNFLKKHILPQVDRALNNVATVGEDFNEILTTKDYFIDEDIEVDYGDIAMAKSCLYAVKTAIKILSAYNIDVDLYDIFCRLEWEELYDTVYGLEEKEFKINEILDMYPEFLKLLPDYQSPLADAKITFKNAIDAYLEGFEFIKNELDNQGDDLLTLDEIKDPKSTVDMDALKNALAGATPVLIDNEYYTMDLNKFFSGKDLRQFLPSFTDDNEIISGSFPYPTLDGILPEFNQKKWREELDLDFLIPGDEDRNEKTTINEVQKAINQLLGISSVKACCDLNGDGRVTIDEVQKAINAFLGIVETIYENTTRSGHIYSNELWKGTIDITGDVIIHTPATVTIEPETTIRFAAGSDDQMHGGDTPITDPYFPNDPPTPPSQMSSIYVMGGTLYAVGTSDSPIVFTSSTSNPERGDWQSIQYGGGKLILQHTIIEYGYYGIQINVAADDSNITLKDNVIRHIVACGICGGIDPNQPVTITISGNDISDCGHEAIDTHSNATLVIENNILHDNLWSYGDGKAGAGVIIDGNNSTIRNNQFIRNRTAIAILTEDSHPIISGNSFVDNDLDCNGFCPDPLQ